MATVAGGIARGLQTGIQIGQQFEDRKRQEEERARQRQLQDEQLANQREDRSRRIAREDQQLELQDEDRAYKALEDEGKALTGEFEGLVQQFGGFDAVPEDKRADLVNRQRAFATRRREANEKRLRPILERERKSATDLMQQIRRGEVRLEDVPDDQFFRAIGVVTKRDPAQLLRQGQGQSQIGTAVQRLLEQIETPSSPEELVTAANIILEPELSKGIGEPGRDGSTIVKKEIARFVPAPSGGKLLPVLKVTVRRADGAMGSYMAPVTEGRSADGDDDSVVQLDLGQAMDYVGRLATLEELVNNPEVRAKIERGAQAGRAGLEEFRSAYSAVGAKPYKRRTKTETVDVGDKKLRITTDEESGKEIGREELTVGINPNRQLAADTSREVASTRAAATTQAANTRAAAAERRGVGAKPMTEQERRQAGINAENQKAKSMGLTFDQTRKTWVSADGKKATPEQLRDIAKAGADVLSRSRPLTREGQANPPQRIRYDAQGNRVE